MKCRVCGGTAVINLRAYNTALCARDFSAFLEKRVLSAIKKYKLLYESDRAVVAVSGGKDSLSIWWILNKLGFPCDGVYVDLAIPGYSERSLSKIQAMADILGRRVFVFPVGDIFDREIDALARMIRRVPCSACGMIKRYAMNRVCMEKDYNVLVTGHNIDDEAAALFGNILYWKGEYLGRKDIVLEGKDGHLSKKIKPFFLCSEREVAAYAILNGIDYILEECPHSVDAKSLVYKGILNKLEAESPGTKIQFVKGYLKNYRSEEKKREERESSFCSRCGYPSYGTVCSFCRIMEQTGTEKEICFFEYTPRHIGNSDILDSPGAKVT